MLTRCQTLFRELYIYLNSLIFVTTLWENNMIPMRESESRHRVVKREAIQPVNGGVGIRTRAVWFGSLRSPRRSPSALLKDCV